MTAPLADGVINLYKPSWATSAQHVYRLRPILGVRRIGHAGSLDPFAEGVLLACVGAATRLVERLMGLPKQYRTRLRLGVTNETFDTERPFELVEGASAPARAEVDAMVAELVGTIEQAPPVFSAIKVGGVASYARAKRGQVDPLAARPVRIDRIDVVSYEWPLLELDITCGRGTYIRAIARDLGARLQCGACCETLQRLAVGPFRLEDALRIERIDDATVWSRLIPIDRVREMIEQPG